MSNFKQTLNELYLAGHITDRFAASSLGNQYDKSIPEKKVALDKHAILILEKFASDNQDYLNNISSIKKNVQFIAWMFIISIVILVMVGIVEVLA